MNWKPGPAKTRDGREARIYAVDGGRDKNLIHGAILTGDVWLSQTWYSDGRMIKREECLEDLIPPKLSRDEVASKCVTAFLQGYDDGGTTGSGVRAVIECYDQLRREGLCDE